MNTLYKSDWVRNSNVRLDRSNCPSEIEIVIFDTPRSGGHPRMLYFPSKLIEVLPLGMDVPFSSLRFIAYARIWQIIFACVLFRSTLLSKNEFISRDKFFSIVPPLLSMENFAIARNFINSFEKSDFSPLFCF